MNIVLIISDTFRRDHLGCYGNPWIHTPNLDRFAKQTIIFDRCYAASFPTIPNRADVLTGKYDFTYLGWAPLRQDECTLPRLLAAEGYSTTAIVDTPFYLRNGYGYDRGFGDFVWIRGQLPGPEREDVTQTWHHEEDRFAPRTMATAERWLERHRKDRFFLLIDTWDPHEPWDPPGHYAEMYLKSLDVRSCPKPCYWSWREAGFSERDVRVAHGCYCGEITMVDRWVGRVLERIESLDLMDETAIIFTSDHGFYFGEHGLLGKARLQEGCWHWSPIYDEVARIPLLIYLPRAKATRIDSFVGPPDLMPTILELAGLDVPPDVHGHSLLPLLQGERQSIRDWAVTSWPLYNTGQRVRLIDDLERGVAEPLPSTFRDDQWTLIYATQDQPLELYRMDQDPVQSNNVAQENETVAQRLHARFISFLEEVGTATELLQGRRQLHSVEEAG